MSKKQEKKESALISLQAFADLVGVARQTVHTAIQRGRITAKKNEKNRYEINKELALKEWEENTDKKAQAKVRKRSDVKDPSEPSKKVTKQATKKVTKKKVSKKLTVAANNKKGYEDNPEGPRTYKGMTIADAERQEKFYKAELAKLKFQEQSGKLMETDKVKKAAFEVGRKIRDNLMAIPAKHSHELAAETEPHKLEILLQRKLNEALSETLEVDFEKLKRQK